MADHCDFTDLPTDQCAHCTGATLDDTGPLAIRWRETPSTARHPGRCAHCDQRYPVGADIVPADVNGDGSDEWCLYDHTRST